MKKILIVCLGNICRSPSAEAVLRAKAQLRGIELEVDSAGIIDFHHGKNPDQRSQLAGEQRGYDFSGIKSRPVESKDFNYFDRILAADLKNKTDLLAICPIKFHYKISLFMEMASEEKKEIPDPYYGGEQGFELVLDLLETASDKILDKMDSF